jgi:hypothetical protein
MAAEMIDFDAKHFAQQSYNDIDETLINHIYEK